MNVGEVLVGDVFAVGHAQWIRLNFDSVNKKNQNQKRFF
jgi:hypothetical protein